MIDLKGFRLKFVDYNLYFEPKEDITAYELSIIFMMTKMPKKVGIEFFSKCLEDESIRRHFKYV